MHRQVSRAFRWVTVLTVPAAVLLIGSARGDDDDATPSWKLGISEWNGSGYEIPAPIRSPEPSNPLLEPASEGGLTYTQPVDPNTLGADVPSGDGTPFLDPLMNLEPMDQGEIPTTNNTAIGLPPAESLNSNSSVPNYALPNSATPWNELNPSAGISNPIPPPSVPNAVPGFNEPLTFPGDATALGTAGSGLAIPPANESTSSEPATESPWLGDPGLGETEPVVAGEPAGEESLPVPTADKLLSPQAAEAPPLEDEVVHWYQYPRRWIRGWDSHAEFGIDGSDGNAVTLALQTGLEMKRKSERSTLALDIDYRKATNRNATVEDNGRFNLDYDYLFADSPWSGFAKYGMEWDRFKAFDLRLNLNGGIGYFWVRDDTTTFVTRFGAGASQEIGAPVDDWIPEAVVGLEAERQLTSRQKIKGKVDYFPAWEDFDDFRLVTDLSWEILLDGTDNLSLKLAATDRYDSTPQGARPNDLYYSMLLLYKF